MPRNKDLKRQIRTRMEKTGESYTTARKQFVKKNPATADFAALAKMSDASVEAKTGRTWKQWVAELDKGGARFKSHKDIARYVGNHYDVSGWWAQMITVGYERIRGKREVGQRCSGDFSANKSKTFAVPLATLYNAWSVKRTRLGWLPEDAMQIRTSTKDKSMRITWPDGTSVHAWFTAKGPQKSTVAVQHVGLAKQSAVTKAKTYWGERLTALSTVLGRRE